MYNSHSVYLTNCCVFLKVFGYGLANNGLVNNVLANNPNVNNPNVNNNDNANDNDDDNDDDNAPDIAPAEIQAPPVQPQPIIHNADGTVFGFQPYIRPNAFSLKVS
jgi:hypothetical protein